MSISVTKQGYTVRKNDPEDGDWNEVSSTYIGNYYSSRWCYYATEFRLTLDKDYESLTLHFAGGHNLPVNARYSIGRPTNLPDDGEAFATAADNSLTVTGDFAEGSTVSIYAWGQNTSGVYTSVGTASADGVEGGSAARVHHNGEFEKYEARIYSGGAWGQYVPYVYDGGEWRKMG